MKSNFYSESLNNNKEFKMTFKEIIAIILPFVGIGIAFCFVPFMMYIVFPFFQNLSPEKKFEKYIDEQCLQGNEIAICIRRGGIRYYFDRDYKLVRAAIEGNEYAIRALKLEAENQTKKNY